jgi:hypothetical protein
MKSRRRIASPEGSEVVGTDKWCGRNRHDASRRQTANDEERRWSRACAASPWRGSLLERDRVFRHSWVRAFKPTLQARFGHSFWFSARRVPLGPQVAANRNRLVVNDVEIDRAELWIARYQDLYALTVLEF